jgi:hypothetical protein
MNKYQYKYAHPRTAEFEKIQKFAKSFDHQIQDHPSIKVFSHYRNGELFGYSDHCSFPIVYPAFHPEFTKPRDVIQVMTDWRHNYEINGSLGYVGVPTKELRPNFPDETMEKLGLVKLNRELYYPS